MASETSSGCTLIQAKALVSTEGISAIAATGRKENKRGGGGGERGVLMIRVCVDTRGLSVVLIGSVM